MTHLGEIVGSPLRKQRDENDERAPERKADMGAQLDELGSDPRQVGPRSAGQSGDLQRLSRTADAANESVDELADSEQSLEAAAVEGVEDAADHPQRPTHTHQEYGRPDDVPPLNQKKRS